MSHSRSSTEHVEVHVENVGGITETDVSLNPGVTVLEGENATNRTSFLRSIMAALGSDRNALKADADEGLVELSVDGETYPRRFERTKRGIRRSGDPYLDDPTVAEHFAFLLETNPARRAVANGEDLRPVIMEPIDTTAIQAEITRKTARRSQLDEQLAELDRLRNRRPELTEQVTQLEADIEEKRDTLAGVRDEIAGTEADLSETKETKAALESAFEEVQSLRSELSSVTDRLAAERESRSAAREEQAEIEAELESVPESVRAEREELESRRSSLRAQKSTLETEVSELQNLIQFNEDRLDEEGTLGEFQAESGTVTDRLVEDGTVTCWTCGSQVERAQITETIERLRELRAEKLDQVTDLEDEIDTLSSEIAELESRADRRQNLKRELDSLTSEIETRTRSIEDLETRRDELEAEIEATEAEIEELEFAQNHEELLDLHQRANRLELEIEQLHGKRDDIETELAEIETELERQEELEAERETIAEELTELRTRVERIETEAVEEFNERMDEILELMDYSNIARIWIERREPESGDTAEFDLHVVRSDQQGRAFEDAVGHLSESEREVTGLVFALAGYLVHDVGETVPFMLLDSVEALDSDRIARLVSYFETHAPYLVIALLPEDARAVDNQYPRITEI
ncbi:archaea-specific SMC-related protein [Halodesulfurarchaeum formicicum]|uniref:archaea-specific SMC-related protein n=1 Tax=Halodesulfurarchaeum formicicum TaxID=1873524 RepID=UPI000878D983|nr:archaea-specific SMC-related protein [Halodesulfurarchaeum formicicum]